MNKSKSLMTLISVALLAISLPMTVYILRTGNLDFRISAFESETPVKITVSDIRDTQFTVSWITEKSLFGAAKLTSSLEPVSETSESSFHTVTVKNLSPNSEVSFQLLSNGQLFNETYLVKTATSPVLRDNRWLYGQVFAVDGVSVQQGGLITLQLTNNAQKSQLLSSIINEAGGYKFNLGQVYDQALQTPFNIDSLSDVELTIHTGVNAEPVTKRYSINLANTFQVPNIYLGDINIELLPEN